MENNELLIPIELDNEIPDGSFGTNEEMIREFGYLPYNIFLYNKRMEENLSRYKFAKKLGISYFRYSYIERGYFKPTKKEIEKISNALQVDYSVYLEGLASYPEGLMTEDKSKPKKQRLKTKPFKITLIVLLLFGIFFFISSKIYNSNINHIAYSLLPRNYNTVLDGISSSEEFTYTLDGSFTRPMIYKKTANEYTTIVGEYELLPFNLNFSYTAFENDYRVTYSTRISDMTQKGYTLSITYVDYTTYDEAKGYYMYIVNNGYEPLSILDTTTLTEVTDTEIKTRINNHIDSFKIKIEELVQERFNVNLSIDNDIIQNVIPTMLSCNQLSLISLLIYLISLVEIVISAMLLTYAFIGGKEKHTKHLLSELDYEDQVLDRYSETKLIPKDIRLGPMIPERIFQIVGGIFTIAFVIMSVVYFVFNVLGKAGMFSNIGLNSAMSLFLTGIFMMLFIDFDIYINDRRVLRNVFIYGIIFFFIYNMQVYLMNSLNQISLGKIAVERFNIRLPNYFGSIALYFMIMVFLFTNPAKANTNKKLIIYRLFALLPISLLIITTTISIGYHAWGWKIPNALSYLIETTKPQVTILVVSYLLGLFFLRNHFKKKYDVKKAYRFFNGNRYLLCRNLMTLGITLAISLVELIFMNNPGAKALGFGLYPTFFLVGILLLFQRPHLGKRKKSVERSTLVLNTILFGSLYIFIALVMILVISVTAF